MTEAIRASTFGYVLLQASQFNAAREAAMEGWSNVMKFPADVTMLSLPVLIESIAGPTWTSPVTRSDATLLRQLLRRAVIVHFSFPNQQPHLQRVAGRAACALGNQRKAVRKFKKAIRLAKKKRMDYQRARSMLDLAAVEDGRDDLRREAVEILKRIESVIPYAERWLLGDQYDEQCVAPPLDEQEQARVAANRR